MKSSSQVWRVVWKDYRTYRSVWLALFGISILIQLLWVILEGTTESARGASMVLALGMPVVFAVAVSAVAFSQEHEVGTYGYLQSLPIGPFDLIIARVLHVLLGSLAMSCALLLLLPMLESLALAGVSLSRAYHGLGDIGTLGLFYGAITLMAVAVGTLCSLLTKHPLRAALIAAIIVCAVQFFGSTATWAWQLLLTLLVAVVLLSIDIQLSRNWLIDASRKSAPGWLTRRFGLNARSAIFRNSSGRLIWAHQRRLRWIYLPMLGLVFSLALIGGPPEMPELLFATSIVAGALGVSVFYIDQRDEAYRFYAAHGISSHVVWVARHAVGLILLSMICLSIYVVLQRPDRPIVLLTFMPLLAYGCGQLTMLVTRSSLIAIFLSFAFSLLMAAWGWMAYWMQVPWWIVIIPFPLGLLSASSVRMRSWILERDSPRDVARPLGIALAGVAVTIVMLAIFRVVEIPNVPASLDTHPRPRSAATSASKVAELHLLQAADLVDPWKPDTHQRGQYGSGPGFGNATGWAAPTLSDRASAWLQENQDALASVNAAFEQTDQLSFPKRDEAPANSFRYSFRSELPSLTHLLIVQARQLQSQGELDASWRAYRRALELSIQLRSQGGIWEWAGTWRNEILVYDQLIWWATADGQTVERIEAAIRDLTQLRDRYADVASAFTRQIQVNDRLIAEAPASLEQFGWPSDYIQTVAFVYRLMPWERTRSHRALRFDESNELEGLIQYSTAIKYGRPVDAILRSQSRRVADPMIERTMLVPQIRQAAYDYSRIDATVRNRHRAAMLQLALVAWKKQHGHYPVSLSELNDEMELEQRDVFTGRAMVYSAEGEDVELFVHLDGRRVLYPKDHPFLWSPELNLEIRFGADPQDDTSHQSWTPTEMGRRHQLAGQLGHSTPEERIWRAGAIYGLP